MFRAPLGQLEDVFGDEPRCFHGDEVGVLGEVDILRVGEGRSEPGPSPLPIERLLIHGVIHTDGLGWMILDGWEPSAGISNLSSASLDSV